MLISDLCGLVCYGTRTVAQDSKSRLRAQIGPNSSQGIRL